MNNQNTQNPQTWLEEIKTRRIDFSPFTEDLSNDPSYIEMKAHQREQATRPDIFKGANLKEWGNIFVVLGVLTFIIPPFGFIFLVIGAVLHSFLPSGVISDEKFIRHNNFIFRNGLRFSQTLPADSVFSAFERATNPLKINIYQKQNFEFGHFRYFTDGEKTYTRNTFYVEQTLPFEVQNLIIDSRATDEFTVGRVKNPNIVSLEGDFNQYFTIETENLYKSQATAFLSPDLMSMLIDYFRGCEIEFFDNKVRIYFPSQISGDLLDVDKVEKNLIHAETFLKNFAEKFKLLEVVRSQEQVIEMKKTIASYKISSSEDYAIWVLVLLLLSIIFIAVVSGVSLDNYAVSVPMAIFGGLFSVALVVSLIERWRIRKEVKNDGIVSTQVRAKRTFSKADFIPIYVVIMIFFMIFVIIFRARLANYG